MDDFENHPRTDTQQFIRLVALLLLALLLTSLTLYTTNLWETQKTLVEVYSIAIHAAYKADYGPEADLLNMPTEKLSLIEEVQGDTFSENDVHQLMDLLHTPVATVTPEK